MPMLLNNYFRIFYTKIKKRNTIEKKSENILPSGDNRLFPFNNSIELILKHSLGLTLNLNKIDLAIPQSITNPLMIKFDSIDNILIVNTCSPKN